MVPAAGSSVSAAYQVCGVRPAGETSPKSARAIAAAPPIPGCHASTTASSASSTPPPKAKEPPCTSSPTSGAAGSMAARSAAPSPAGRRAARGGRGRSPRSRSSRRRRAGRRPAAAQCGSTAKPSLASGPPGAAAEARRQGRGGGSPPPCDRGARRRSSDALAGAPLAGARQRSQKAADRVSPWGEHHLSPSLTPQLRQDTQQARQRRRSTTPARAGCSRTHPPPADTNLHTMARERALSVEDDVKFIMGAAAV